MAAPLTDLDYWPSAFGLAFIYGFFFVGGTGYRILIAVATVDASRKTSASWSGATTGTALAALIASLLFGELWQSLLVLASYGVAINAAYIPVKLACLEAGCCQAHHRDPVVIRQHDLRRVEITLSAMALAASLIAMLSGAPGAAAILGTGGHLAVRLLSRWSRDRLPGVGPDSEIKGQELLPLTAVLAASLWFALAP